MSSKQKKVIKKIMPIHSKQRSCHPKWVNLSTFWKILALGHIQPVVKRLPNIKSSIANNANVTHLLHSPPTAKSNLQPHVTYSLVSSQKPED